MHPIGRIKEIWRYPVSSVGGERLLSASLSAAGVAGDREYGLIDFASSMPATPEKDQRWRKALDLQALCVAGQLPTIFFPNRHSYPLDDPSLNSALSDYFGFATAIAAYDHIGKHSGFPLTHHRHHFYPVHLLTTSSLDHLANLRQVEKLDSRRFRPTVLIETNGDKGFLENQWIGKGLRLGSIDLMAHELTKRCGMTFISQPGLEEDPEILRNILRHNKRNLGIYCSIESAGTLEVGDELFV